TPTLAILNIRLGYWMKNPAFWAPTGAVSTSKRTPPRACIPKHRSTLLLWSEITGRLYENADEVYLTDGGHIENLGMYELLRRRFRFILAIDVEPDVALHFHALVRLESFARIDHGIRITLPWDAIRMTTLSLMSAAAGIEQASPPSPQPGPHAAIG